ncbi:type VII secretion integral membrane protein EccD [Nocardia sp. NPDC003693]
MAVNAAPTVPAQTPTAPAQTPAEVARVRAAIMVAGYQVDVVLPAKFGIETYIDDLITVLASAIDDETVVFTPERGQWTLARPGATPMPRWVALADHDVTDGALLLLATVESSEAFTPVVEDITDGLALINEREFAEFDSGTASSVGAVALAVGAAAAAALLSWSWTRTGSVLWCALPAVVLGLACWLAALRAHRSGQQTGIRLGLALSALPLLFAGAAMTVPPAHGEPGPFAAANFAAGAAVVAIVAIALLRATGIGAAALVAVAALGIPVAVAAGVAAFLDPAVRQVMAALVLAGLILLTAAPRTAVLLARIRPPDLPDPGREVAAGTLTDIFDAESARTEDTDADEADTAVQRESRGAGIEDRARRAVTSLRGLVGAVSALLAFATVLTVANAPGGIREIVMAVAVAGILVMRTRWFPDRVQALTLIAAATLTVLGTVSVLVGAYATAPARLVAVAAVVAVAAAGCVAGTRLPQVRLSPVVRRVIDLVEYALIVTVPVLACWIMGIYTAMRER